MNYNISNEASLDLEEIWLYTFEHWSIEQADKYYNQLLNEIEYISKNPKKIVTVVLRHHILTNTG